MKLFIKNMICERCKIFVQTSLQDLDISVKYIDRGEVELVKALSVSERNALNEELKKAGLEILDDKQEELIEKIKQVVFDYVYYNEGDSALNLSVLLSQKLGYNYTYLTNFFSEIEGKTIEKYRISLKIERIKELILLREYTFSEIAFMLHYSSIGHLSNQFKKMTGLTPSRFKKSRVSRRCSIQEL